MKYVHLGIAVSAGWSIALLAYGWMYPPLALIVIAVAPVLGLGADYLTRAGGDLGGFLTAVCAACMSMEIDEDDCPIARIYDILQAGAGPVYDASEATPA